MKLLLSNNQGVGDVLMLTAVVKDLAEQYRNAFEIECETPYADLWKNNPHVRQHHDSAPPAEADFSRRIKCCYPLIHRSRRLPYHFIHGFYEFLSKELQRTIRPSSFHGDIHLSDEERNLPSPLTPLGGSDLPYWLVVAGGKYDFTIKWWEFERWQKVVDHFYGRIQFVQVGVSSDYHPQLKNCIDLRGRTSIRQLIHLVYHCEGILCPVTGLMHLAAAVPIRQLRRRRPPVRPCVVVAGGREPAHWEQYPGHQLIHTIGALRCCAHGGCWKSRTVPLGDGDPKDRHLCVDVVNNLPRCMDMITAEEVIRRVELYFQGGACRYLNEERTTVAISNNPLTKKTGPHLREPLTVGTARARAEEFVQTIPQYSGGYRGRGIVICAGGALFHLRLGVRQHAAAAGLPTAHSTLVGEKECDEKMRSLVAPLGVECVDALEIRRKHPADFTRGWPIKPYAIIHAPFKEVLLLDADNVPVVNPEFLFDTPEFQKTGAIFWPDFKRLARERAIWAICGVEYRDEPEFESGQIVVDKKRCWKSLQLTMWYNEHAEFFYQHVHGDKETFHMAWRKIGQEYAMPSARIFRLRRTMCQHDFRGGRVFQHRNMDKWSLHLPNKHISGFLFERECFEFLNDLRTRWQGLNKFDLSKKTEPERRIVEEVIREQFRYHRVGYDQRPMTFQSNGVVGTGAAACETFWDVRQENGHVLLEISSENELTCRLKKDDGGIWTGRWEKHERMPVQLEPLNGAIEPRHDHQTSVLFRASINAFTGYGLHACQIVRDLERMGIDVRVIPREFDDRFAEVPSELTRKFVYEPQDSEWELLLNPPNIPTTRKRKTVYFTMWEATQLPTTWAGFLNAAHCLVVPCRWNAESFQASGVTRPIHIIPLGINTDVFRPVAMNTSGACVFGVAGRMAGGGARKGLNEVVALFQEAFPSGEDVRLRVKCFPDCGAMPTSDPRVDIAARYFTEIEMADWYASLTCFVSMSRSEGWGLMPHQAMATGRPCIITKFGGHAEFVNEENSYCARYEIVPAGHSYAGQGVWAEPDPDHIITLMREVYQNRERAQKIGLIAMETTSKLTWKNSNEKLVEILRNVGMIASHVAL